MQDILIKATKIKLLICDVDGVLTRGDLHFNHDGVVHSMTFHVHDGVGLQLLMNTGVEVGVITTSLIPIVEQRIRQLGIKHFYKGQVNKITAYENLQQRLDLADEQIAYVGDDVPDLPLIQRVGLGIAVANAIDIVREQAAWRTTKEGGNGAVREVCELIMRAQKTTQQAIDKFLSKKK